MQTNKWINGGLQQIGIGVKDNDLVWRFYREELGFDIPMFDETSTADIMAPYMGGQSWERHALLAINLNGGGGLEIWQFTNRIPVGPSQEISLENTGIIAIQIRCQNIFLLREQLLKKGYEISSPVFGLDDCLHCMVRDPEYNWLCLVETNRGWFVPPKKQESAYCGGVCGTVIGVSNMDESIAFYRDVCGFDIESYDQTDVFHEFDIIRGQQRVRRVGMRRSYANQGTFAHLLTDTSIELIEAKEQKANHFYQDRYWGDLGFIHLCFDVRGMDVLKEHCTKLGYPFTIDTGEEFSMDDASGRFAYLEDPDGTLIEFVEVYKMPILAKYGIVLNIKKRAMGKPLSKFMMRALRFRRKNPTLTVD